MYHKKEVMTQAQQRASALQAARYQLRRMKFDVYQATAREAHHALDEYARLYPAMGSFDLINGAFLPGLMPNPDSCR